MDIRYKFNEILFEWDEEKNHINQKKHGVRFEVAALVFLDENRYELVDWQHSNSEEIRYVTVGMTRNQLILLTLYYTERGERIRIISARKANQRESEAYYDGLLYS